MFLPASYQALKDMPFGCPSGLNTAQRAACMSGQCRGRNCLYIGDARIVVPPRMPQVMQTVTPAVTVQTVAVTAGIAPTPSASSAPASTASPAASSIAAVAQAGAAAGVAPSLLQNAWAWVQANPLLAGGLVLGALLLMHGGKR